MSLPDLYGHEPVREYLLRAVRAGTLPQSVMLHGPAGVGKERIGLWLAQLLLCERPEEPQAPCDQCRACRQVRRLEHPDLHWFFPLPRPEGASAERLRDKLEEARAAELQRRREHPNRPPSYDKAPAHFLAAVQTLQQVAANRPVMGDRRVFVVGDAELMVPQEASQEAANAFLKLLEEPPAGTHLVITTSNPGALLATIRSRVLPVRVAPLAEREIRDFLLRECAASEAEAERVAVLGRGSIGRALRLLPGDDGPTPLERMRERGRALLLAALSRSPTPRYAIAQAQAPTGGRGDFSGELESFAEQLRDLMAVASGATDAAIDEDSTLQRAVEQLAIEPLGVADAIRRVARAQELAFGNVNPQLILAVLLEEVHRALHSTVPA